MVTLAMADVKISTVKLKASTGRLLYGILKNTDIFHLKSRIQCLFKMQSKSDFIDNE